MNTPLPLRAPRPLLARVLPTLLACAFAPATAGPGAHGPNGEHLDAPTPVVAASSLPRVEAQSEAFELVAELRASELSIVVDRYASNEPVLGAKLEVESGALKAVAAFRAEHGDYAVTDAAFVKALAAPGEHGLVFTLLAGQDSDLLDGTLVNTAGRVVAAAAKNDHGHAHGTDDRDHGPDHAHDHERERAAWIGAGAAAVGLIGGIAWWRQRRRVAGQPRGGL